MAGVSGGVGAGDETAAGTGLAEIERAAVRGWPALETADVDGWLLRASSGGSTRANTVAALDYDGGDLNRSLAAVEAFYRARGATPRFTITDVSRPAGLDAMLAARGWSRNGDHVTMAKAIAGDAGAAPASARGAASHHAAGIEVVRHAAPTTEWFAIYLEAITPDRRAVAPRLVERVPAPRAFFTAMKDGEAVASGLSVIDGPLASVQCMATLAARRRTGAARMVLAAIEANARAEGVRRLYLQAEGANTAAITLYASVGFEVVGAYHTRQLDRS